MSLEEEEVEGGAETVPESDEMAPEGEGSEDTTPKGEEDVDA